MKWLLALLIVFGITNHSNYTYNLSEGYNPDTGGAPPPTGGFMNAWFNPTFM